MGGYGFYVWVSYGACALVVIAEAGGARCALALRRRSAAR